MVKNNNISTTLRQNQHDHMASLYSPPEKYRRRLLVSILAMISCMGGVVDKAYAEEQDNSSHAIFNSSFLSNSDGEKLDLSRFENGAQIEPGNYNVDVYVNHIWIGRKEVRVLKNDSDNKNTGFDFCFQNKLLVSLGIDFEKLPINGSATDENGCVNIEKLVPDSKLDFDMSSLRANLSIPQAYLKRREKGYVEPEHWDRGINAAFIDYNANTYQIRFNQNDTTQYFLGINAGLNLGAWRLRHNGSYSQRESDQTESTREYKTLSNYIQRDITSLKSQLTLGEYYTPSELFDSFPYTGVQLASDDRMQPDSRRGYAPTVYGTAESNALVTIRQGGNTIYESTVAPGPFVIDDLYGVGYAGDLDVTVKEADGRTRSFTVPFSTVPQLLRPSVSRYNVVIGKYRDDDLNNTPEFLQASYQYGISNALTGYTGGILAENYYSAQIGVALSTVVGAFSFDVTQAHASELPSSSPYGTSTTGQTYRFNYSKLLEASKTNLTMAAYRFSSRGYVSFPDYVQLSDNQSTHKPYRLRNRFQANINQPLGEGFGNIFLSGSTQNYWDDTIPSETGFQAGYSNRFRWGSFTISAGRTRLAGGKKENQYMLSFSTPLGRSVRAPYLTSSVTHSDNGTTNAQLGLNGSLGEYSQFGYGAYTSYNENETSHSQSFGVNMQYRASNAALLANYSDGKGYRQIGAGMSGSVLLHGGGVNFTQTQGETKTLVEAKGARGATLRNSSGAKIASNGYVVASALMPYRNNAISIDPKGISEEIELTVTEQVVAPRYGSITYLQYPTVSGKPLMLLIHDQEGKNLPIGAEVLDETGKSVTLVGQGSRVYIRADQEQGHLLVRWGRAIDQQCRVDYKVPQVKTEAKVPFLQLDATCTRDH